MYHWILFMLAAPASSAEAAQRLCSISEAQPARLVRGRTERVYVTVCPLDRIGPSRLSVSYDAPAAPNGSVAREAVAHGIRAAGAARP